MGLAQSVCVCVCVCVCARSVSYRVSHVIPGGWKRGCHPGNLGLPWALEIVQWPALLLRPCSSQDPWSQPVHLLSFLQPPKSHCEGEIPQQPD